MSEKTEELLRGANIGILLPHVQTFRSAARLFIIDNSWAVEQGDSDRVVENIETMFGLARQSSEYPILVCGLVGMAVSHIGFNEIEKITRTHPDFFDEQQLARLQNAVENISIREMVKFEGEHAMMYDFIQRIYTDNGKGDGRITPEGVDIIVEGLPAFMVMNNGIDDDEFNFEDVLMAAKPIAAPAALFMMASRKEMREKYEELIARAEARFDAPYWVGLEGESEIYQVLKEQPIRYYLLNLIMPALEQVHHAMERKIAMQDATIVALAALRYEKQNHRWASSFEELTPEYVAEFPFDRLNGALLNYKADETGFIVYSVGNDRDDDNGMPAFGDSLEEELSSTDYFRFRRDAENVKDGDWILWPRVRNDQ